MSASTVGTNTRLALVLPLAVVATAPSLGTLSALWWWPGSIGPIIYLACKIVLYGIPSYALIRTFTRSVCAEGIYRGTRLPSLAFGVLSGAGISAFILCLWFFFAKGRIDVSPLVDRMNESGMNQVGRYVAFGLWLSIGNSLLEEFVFRWFVDGKLRLLGFSNLWTIVISAAIFTIHHVLVLLAFFDTGPAMVFSCGIFAGGALWSWTHMKWGSLISGWISHALVDIAVLLVGFNILFG